MNTDYYRYRPSSSSGATDVAASSSRGDSALWATSYPWLSFTFDHELKIVYEKFVSANQSWIFQVLLNLIHIAMSLPIIQYVGRDNTNTRNATYVVFSVLDVLLMILVFLSGWILALHLAVPSLQQNPYFHCIFRYKQQLQMCFIVGFNVANCLYIVERAMDSGCIYNSSECDANRILKVIPSSNRVINILLPTLCITVLREWRITVIAVTWVVSVIVFSISNTLVQASTAPFLIIFYSVGSAMIIVEVLRQNFRMFISSKRLEDAMRENEELAAQEKASDLRHMIANVAHDLKTPLSSFMVGTELIQQLVDEMLSKYFNGKTVDELDKSAVQSISDALRVIQSSVHDISSTNAFMVMTINRCIDYTKASKGMKLTPKNETVSIRETVMLPLQCMRNVQQKVSIVLSDMPVDLCSHIVTDKQWLQENILCLLSNASKYSDGGTVSVTLSLAQSSTLALDSLDRSSAGRSVVSTMRSYIVSMGTAKDELSTVSGITTLTPLQLVVEVQDEGIGVPDELMSSLFNPFKQTQKLAGGTGLGLYSLAKRVEALQGSCGVRKRLDGVRGSVFWFSIPYRPDELFASTSKMENIGIPLPAQVRSPKRIVEETQGSSSSIVSRGDWAIHSSNIEEDDSISAVPSFPSRHVSDILFIPKRESEEIKSEIVASSPHVVPTPHTSLKILLAEDSPTISKVQMMMLKKQGHRVTLAENGAIAVRAFEDSFRSDSQEVRQPKLTSNFGSSSSTSSISVNTNSQSNFSIINTPCISLPPERFDLILMDLQMPVMDGLEAVRRIRAFEKQLIESGDSAHFARQKIIGVSANSDDETIRQAFAMGIDAFLPKPFTQKALEEIVRSIKN